MMKKKGAMYVVGIDEVGRGPLAGPVAVGACSLKIENIKTKTKEGWFRGLKDSKKLSAQAREEWVVKIKQAQKEGWLDFSVAFVAPQIIDTKGLSYSIRTALARALKTLDSYLEVELPSGFLLLGSSTSKWGEVEVLLDGGLYAPARYKNQKTIIKGDEKEPAIALASIVAKVARDKRMITLAKKFPEYGFEKHKGYGTRAHYEAIKKHGTTKHHRKSFLKGII